MRATRAVLTGLCLLALTPAAAPAAPPWSAPADVEGTRGSNFAPRFRFAPDGTGIFSTGRSRPCPDPCGDESIVVPIRNGRVEAGRTLPRTPRGHVAPFGNGRLVSVGRGRRGGLRAAFGTLARGFGRARLVGFHTRGFFTWAVNGRGAVAVVFVDRRGVELAYRPAGRSFRRPVLIDRVRRATYAPAVTLNERGDVLVAWADNVSDPDSSRDLLRVRLMRARGTLGPQRALGTVCDLWPGDLELTNSLDALVAWQDECRGEASVAYARRGRFARRQLLEARPGGAEEPRAIEAELVPGGGFVAWQSGAEQPAIRVAALAGRSFGAAQTLAEGGDPRLGGLATGPRGEALVAWIDGAEGERRVAAAARAPGAATFGASEEIAAAQPTFGADIAIDPTSRVPFVFWSGPDAVVRWSQRTPVG